MPTLLVDATSLSINPKGVGKYAYEVITRLDRLLPDSWQILLIVFRDSMPPLNCSKRLMSVDVDHQPDLQLGLFTVPKLIRQHQPDLLLRLCDCVGNDYPVQALTVCHDINELIIKAQGGELVLLRRLINGVKEYFRIRALQASELVVCNSEFTRNQCISRYGISAEKSAIGYCGISADFYGINRDDAVARIRSAFGCEDYVLCFATGDPRENYGIVPEVIAATKRQGLRTQYLIAGVREGDAYALELREKLLNHSLIEGCDFIIAPFLGAKDRQLLCDLYAAANYYLELSLHEGFGMQLAEAMASGTQCFAPDHSALSEVGGAFVRHIDPTNAQGIAEVISGACKLGLHLKDHSAQVEYTKKFSWDQSATVIAEQLISLNDSQS